MSPSEDDAALPWGSKRSRTVLGTIHGGLVRTLLGTAAGGAVPSTPRPGGRDEHAAGPALDT